MDTVCSCTFVHKFLIRDGRKRIKMHNAKHIENRLPITARIKHTQKKVMEQVKYEAKEKS